MKSDSEEPGRLALDRKEEMAHVQGRATSRQEGPPLRAGGGDRPEAEASQPTRPIAPWLWLLSGVAALLGATAAFWPGLLKVGPSREPAVYAPTLAPLVPVAGGEQTAKFDGFALIVESEPSGADVTVDGTERGVTPAAMNLDCAPGTPLKVEVQMPSYKVHRQVVLCRANTLVKLSPRLLKGK